jgi:hypothetical protein
MLFELAVFSALLQQLLDFFFKRFTLGRFGFGIVIGLLFTPPT